MKIITNTFALRHTAASPFSHYTGTWSQLEALVAAHFDQAVPGYRPGVLLVPVPPMDLDAMADFYSGVVVVDNATTFVVTYEPRRPGEEPFIDVKAIAPKEEAVAVEVVLYSRALLAEDGSNTDPSADFEIVSINARTSHGPEPMTPMAMARNMLGLTGGTKATYTAEEFAVAIYYWSQRAMQYGGPAR